MTIKTIKQKLLAYMEYAEDKKLRALYTLLEDDIENCAPINEAMIKELDRQWDEYLGQEPKKPRLGKAIEKVRAKAKGRKKE